MPQVLFYEAIMRDRRFPGRQLPEDSMFRNAKQRGAGRGGLAVSSAPAGGANQNVTRALNCNLRGELAIEVKMPKVAESIPVPGAAK